MLGRIFGCAALVVSVQVGLAEERRAELPVTADVGLTSVRGKQRFSNGAGPSSPIRQNQNWSGFENKTLLMAFDTKAIRGWTVRRANLTVTIARGDLHGVGLCTVLAPWSEGGAKNWVEQTGAACWSFARCPARDAKPTSENYWCWPGSAVYSVAWAHPHARYSHAGPAQLKRKRVAGGRFIRLTVPVDPALVESLAIGAAYGLVLTDDKGQVGEAFALQGPGKPYRYDEFEDVCLFTKEVQDPAFRPVLEVFGGAVDKTPPAAPAGLKVTGVSPGDGTVHLELAAPGDDAGAGTALAYEAVYSPQPITEANWAKAAPLPRWSIPNPAPAGETQKMPLFTLPAGRHHLAMRAVDEAGNRGPAAAIAVTVPVLKSAALAKVAAAPRPRPAAPPSAGGKLSVYACPDMVKADPVTGAILRDGGAYRIDLKYAQANAVWRADRRLVELTAAANEVAAFKLILKKTAAEALRNVRVSVSDLAGARGGKIASAGNIQCFRMWYVKTGASTGPKVGPGDLEDVTLRPSAWHADACLPLVSPFDESFDLPAPDNRIPSQNLQAVWVDVYVPRGTPAGRYTGKLSVSADGLPAPIAINLRVQVLPFALPDEISWRIELNRYGPVTGFAGVKASQAVATEHMYHRLAQQHRATINMLPYSQSSGTYAGVTPALEGEGTGVKVADWSDWDARFGPVLDGSAFSAEAGYVGPGADTPLSHMYLPFCEGWPLPLNEATFKDFAKLTSRVAFGQWAKTSRRPSEAFSEAFEQGYARIARQFFEHFKAKGWTGTKFQFYFNNKYYFKVPFFGGGFHTNGTSFWLLDEPVDFDDYDANRFFLTLARRGYEAARAPKVQVEYRTDISHPSMTRGLWDGVCDLWNCSAMFGFAPTANVRQRWLPRERYWHYGGGPGPSAPHINTAKLFLSSYCLGTDGELPYWTFGGKNWRGANRLTAIWTGQNYAASGKNHPGPIAGARLKAIRRGQQDVEYLYLLARQRGWDRARVRRALASYSDDPDAPTLGFGRLSLERWIHLRKALAATIVAAGGR